MSWDSSCVKLIVQKFPLDRNAYSAVQSSGLKVMVLPRGHSAPSSPHYTRYTVSVLVPACGTLLRLPIVLLESTVSTRKTETIVCCDSLLLSRRLLRSQFTEMSYHPIVQELVAKLDADRDFKEAMESSLALALSTRIKEFDLLNIHSLEEYIAYMNRYLHWLPCETPSGKNVYIHICMFYFIIDLPPVSSYQNPIDPSQHPPWQWLTEWLIRYAQEVGAWMDTPESINSETIQSFHTAKGYHMEDYPVPPGGWKTFNEFFSRHIDPRVRPIASPEDDRVIVNPADCTFDGHWDVVDEAHVSFKGVPWTIGQLLEDHDFGPRFAGGKFTHSFLAPNDYHRQHAPVSGRVVEAKVIPGICYLEVVLQSIQSGDATYSTRDVGEGDSTYELGMHRYMRNAASKHIPAEDRAISVSSAAPVNDITAPDSPGYQFLQARGLILIENPVLGLVAVLPIGMAQVSSVKLSVKEGDVVEKGDEIACFHLGGSDIIMVFQKDANVQFNQEIGTHYNFGQAVATGGK